MTTMTIEAAELRRIMGHFCTGVTVVASRNPETGEPCGLTASAVASVSLSPALVLACVDRSSDTHASIQRAGYYSINILPDEEERLSRRFASSDAAGKFEGVGWRQGTTGAPILEEAMAWVDCRVWATYPAGDHTIFVGEVMAGDATAERPLLYFRGGYRWLAP